VCVCVVAVLRPSGSEGDGRIRGVLWMAWHGMNHPRAPTGRLMIGEYSAFEITLTRAPGNQVVFRHARSFGGFLPT
jgi:hypothetical protein